MNFLQGMWKGTNKKCAVLQALRRAGGRGTSFRSGGRVSACDDTKKNHHHGSNRGLLDFIVCRL